MLITVTSRCSVFCAVGGKSWLPFFPGFPWVFHQKTQNDICHGFWFLQLHFSAIQLQISEHTKYEPQLGAFSVHFSVGVCVGGCLFRLFHHFSLCVQ